MFVESLPCDTELGCGIMLVCFETVLFFLPMKTLRTVCEELKYAKLPETLRIVLVVVKCKEYFVYKTINTEMPRKIVTFKNILL